MRGPGVSAARPGTHRGPGWCRCRRTPPAYGRGGAVKARTPARRSGPRPRPIPAPRSPTWARGAGERSSLQPHDPDGKEDLRGQEGSPSSSGTPARTSPPRLPLAGCAPPGLALTQGSSGEAPASVIADRPERTGSQSRPDPGGQEEARRPCDPNPPIRERRTGGAGRGCRACAYAF